MNLKEKFPTRIIDKIKDRPTIEIENLGIGVFHNWLSKDTLVFIGRQERNPFTIEVHESNIIKTPEGAYVLKKPYGIFPSNDFTKGELNYILDKRLK